MLVTIQLLAGDDPVQTVEVSRTIELHTAGPAWQDELVSAIGAHARDTAQCLVDQIDPRLPAAAPSFVPLAHVLPTCG
jgi:hypothetical protein